MDSSERIRKYSGRIGALCDDIEMMAKDFEEMLRGGISWLADYATGLKERRDQPLDKGYSNNSARVV